MQARRAAAFFRVEGVLVDRPTLLAPAYLAANAQRMGERVWRLGYTALAAPLRAAGGLAYGTTALRLAYGGLRDLSEDRLRELGRDYAERYLVPNELAAGRSLLELARKRGLFVVLVTQHVEPVATPLAARFEPDLVVANRLEMRRGVTTGRLLDPVVGAIDGAFARGLAAEHGLDLERSYAYGAHLDDGLLLSAIPNACAVAPDFGLRRLAADRGWPVVEA